MDSPRLKAGLVTAALGLLLTACAGTRGASAGGTPTAPVGLQSVAGAKTVLVGPESEGKTVVLRMGDSLEFADPADALPPGIGWRVVSYPSELLKLTSPPGTNPIRFGTLRPGSGTIRLETGPPCRGPGPATAGVTCPVAGDGSTSLGGMPVRSLTFAVRVFPPGI